MSHPIGEVGKSCFPELQNCRLCLAPPCVLFSILQHKVRYLRIELWSCVHFLVRPLSEVQNCSEFRRVHPVASAHGLSDLLSTLRIRKRVVQDIPKKLLSICGTVVTFLCGKCPNCRTVVSLGRSLWAATLRPPNPHFGAWLRSLTFLVHSL